MKNIFTTQLSSVNNCFQKQVLIPVLHAIQSYPEKNAFCINEQFYTYKYWGECISKIRFALKEKNFSNDKVGLVVNDDLETYASIFALWLEGKCYVPLHPGQPLERCNDIIEQVGIDLILDSSEVSRYPENMIISTIISSRKETKIALDVSEYSDDKLAYILFTSGSTGKPKGVMISRRNIGAFMDSFWKTGIVITQEDRCLQCFDLTFDVSVQSYLVALTRGACVYTVPSGNIKYVSAATLIEEHKITFGAMAPSMLRYLKPYFEELDATSLKVCILTAEACPLRLMEEWHICASNTDIYDFYGPTEATIYCTYYKLVREGDNKSFNGIVSIGKPLSNVISIIIDENGIEVPNGKKGELCVAGDQITRGYWNNTRKNNEAFFEKIINGQSVRFYHTGDLCFRDDEGDIMYSGRIDNQAKIQGFRVELGEIEFHARDFLKEINVVALAFENSLNITEIALFIESEIFDTIKLFVYLRSKMPSYMIPTKIIFEPVFPLNSNDKIDKNKLKSLIK
ncbi:AMP-binding protein [uncultured Sanguibacteroides sp.]|uniref:AMP-binding protein n=1 Tax=uncultured Sanguibacteroides sp. TaxID=1635151 RepID=UPI0025E26CF8|nr:AMP-binding protein [uncultured Sanguibacteroides sp.]